MRRFFLEPAGHGAQLHIILHNVSALCFAALTIAAVSFITSNYSGSVLTAFITLAAALLDVQVCSVTAELVCYVCQPASQPATQGKTDEKG